MRISLAIRELQSVNQGTKLSSAREDQLTFDFGNLRGFSITEPKPLPDPSTAENLAL